MTNKSKNQKKKQQQQAKKQAASASAKEAETPTSPTSANGYVCPFDPFVLLFGLGLVVGEVGWVDWLGAGWGRARSWLRLEGSIALPVVRGYI